MNFDSKGRCLPNLTNFPAHKKSRYYFNLDEKINNNINLKEIFENISENISTSLTISYDDFEKKIKNIKENLSSREETKNILNGYGFPFIIPKLPSEDIGTNLQNIFLPALEKSYRKKFPNYEFQNHVKFKLEKKIDLWENSRYEKVISRSLETDVVGIFFTCLNEFSLPAAIDIINKLPENFILSGGYEIISAIIGKQNILMREDKYSPLLWFSSMKNANDDNLSYHIEPYGYNITFNERAHLNEAAEYWWHSITYID